MSIEYHVICKKCLNNLSVLIIPSNKEVKGATRLTAKSFLEYSDAINFLLSIPKKRLPSDLDIAIDLFLENTLDYEDILDKI